MAFFNRKVRTSNSELPEQPFEGRKNFGMVIVNSSGKKWHNSITHVLLFFFCLEIWYFEPFPILHVRLITEFCAIFWHNWSFFKTTNIWIGSFLQNRQLRRLAIDTSPPFAAWAHRNQGCSFQKLLLAMISV